MKTSMARLVLWAASILLGCLPLTGAAEDSASGPPVGTGKFLVIDFENTPVGQVPPGFTKTGDVGVVDDVAHTGRKSLRMGPAERGPRRITLKGEVPAALGSEHWGRLYFKVKLPTPQPQGSGKFPVIHSTLVSGLATSPLFKDPIEVRVLDTILGPKGTFGYIYNVQPKKRPEFARGSHYDYHYSDQWTLAEWHIDFATQTYELFINGQRIPGASFTNGAGKFEKSEIPQVFQSLSFGWNNYQPAGEGFTAWIDDIALGKDRIGDRGIALDAKKQ